MHNQPPEVALSYLIGSSFNLNFKPLPDLNVAREQEENIDAQFLISLVSEEVDQPIAFIREDVQMEDLIFDGQNAEQPLDPVATFGSR